ncbi:MAG: hypothetical protein ACI8QC_000869 [Planctomycetota bacterium]
MIRVATAGWSYPDWEGRVYPRAKPSGFHPLRHLSRYLDGIEVNSPFYALPRPDVVSRWAEIVQAQPEFRFVVKLYQGFTHRPVDEGRWKEEAASFLTAMQPLQRKQLLSAVLVQFPVTFQHGAEEVRRLGRLRALFPDLPLVLELRHQSWFERPAFDTIRGLSYSLAHVDLPVAWNHPPERHGPTGPIGYLRLHGRNSEQWFRKEATRDERYDYLYNPPEVGELTRKAASIASETDETWIVTNNHFAGQAVANAIEIQYMLAGKKPVPAWPEIVSSYPHLGPLTEISGQGLFPT